MKKFLYRFENCTVVKKYLESAILKLCAGAMRS